MGGVGVACVPSGGCGEGKVGRGRCGGMRTGPEEH